MAHQILLIDDNDEFRALARRMLVTAGYEVQEAANGAIGLACYRKRRSDVVITDILMPETEGLETIRELRRENPDVRIIAISGADSARIEGYLNVAIKFGARRILPKPFTQHELITAVSDVLAK